MKKTILILAAATLLAAACQTEPQPVVNDPAEVVMTNILNRKSVRSYTGDTIPAEVMENLLRAAMAAPSGRNIQPWSFVVLNDTSRYDEIFGENFNMGMYKQSAAVVVVCADTTVVRPPRDNPDAPAVQQPNGIWRDDMGAVTENLLLAVEAHGLGACWTACYPYADRMEPVKKALGLPATVVPYSVVPIGYPAGDEQPKDKWDASRIHYNNW
ncbi:MAG: nitroreductase family protein [Bacteroidales bacterium]|nr:nitroreductase family protein [Bacteroidales bacterium]